MFKILFFVVWVGWHSIAFAQIDLSVKEFGLEFNRLNGKMEVFRSSVAMSEIQFDEDQFIQFRKFEIEFDLAMEIVIEHFKRKEIEQAMTALELCSVLEKRIESEVLLPKQLVEFRKSEFKEYWTKSMNSVAIVASRYYFHELGLDDRQQQQLRDLENSMNGKFLEVRDPSQFEEIQRLNRQRSRRLLDDRSIQKIDSGLVGFIRFTEEHFESDEDLKRLALATKLAVRAIINGSRTPMQSHSSRMPIAPAIDLSTLQAEAFTGLLKQFQSLESDFSQMIQQDPGNADVNSEFASKFWRQLKDLQKLLTDEQRSKLNELWKTEIERSFSGLYSVAIRRFYLTMLSVREPQLNELDEITKWSIQEIENIRQLERQQLLAWQQETARQAVDIFTPQQKLRLQQISDGQLDSLLRVKTSQE